MLMEPSQFLQAVSQFGAWGVVVWVLYQHQNLIREVMEHNRQLIDKLIDKNGGGKSNGNGSNNSV